MREKLRLLTPTLKETTIIVILAALFTFLSFIVYVRTEPFTGTYIDRRGYEWPPGIMTISYGLPLEFVKIWTHERSSSHTTGAYLLETEILWTGLVVDLIFYFLLSFSIVLVTKMLAHS